MGQDVLQQVADARLNGFAERFEALDPDQRAALSAALQPLLPT
jgi:hypothetical protein